MPEKTVQNLTVSINLGLWLWALNCLQLLAVFQPVPCRFVSFVLSHTPVMMKVGGQWQFLFIKIDLGDDDDTWGGHVEPLSIVCT